MATFGGIVEKTSNNGNSGNWPIPTGTTSIRGVAIGGGGSGHQDDTGDDKGGGGGGGGKAGGFKNVGQSTVITWQQANRAKTKAGGSETPGSGSTDGGESYVYGNSGRSWAYASGGEGGTDDNGGAGGGSGNGNEFNVDGNRGQDDDDGGYGGGCAGCPNGQDRGGGTGCTVNWNNNAGTVNTGCGPTPSGKTNKTGQAFGGAGAGSWEDSNPETEYPAGRGGKGYAGWAYFFADPSIDSSSVNHQYNTNLALGEEPSDEVTISWTASNVQRVEIKKNGIVYATETQNPTNSSATISTGLNSNAVNNSPATKTYNIVAYGYGGNTVKKEVTVKVKNDDNPSKSDLTTDVENLDPATQVTINIGSLDEVDMPVWITTDDEGVAINNQLGQKKVGPGNDIKLKFNTLPYEVDITGRTDEETGKRAFKTITLQMGPHKTHEITFKTKRPIIKETFDSFGEKNALPYPKINIGDDDPKQYLSASSVDVNDIEFTKPDIIARLEDGEISTEVKVSDENLQIKRNSNSWKTPRGI